jgi:hypothetical protein
MNESLDSDGERRSCPCCSVMLTEQEMDEHARLAAGKTRGSLMMRLTQAMIDPSTTGAKRTELLVAMKSVNQLCDEYDRNHATLMMFNQSPPTEPNGNGC